MVIAPIISFLAGIASVLSPCVLPVIPLLIGYVLMERRKTEILSFVFGLSLIFLVITFLTIIFTAAINYYLYYARITAVMVLILLGLIIIWGKYSLSYSMNTPSKDKKSILGAFLWGIMVSLAWISCFTPYLIALIAYSVSTGDTVFTIINLVSYISGFSITILLLGLGISSINIKKLASYSSTIRIVSGSLFILMGLYLLIVSI